MRDVPNPFGRYTRDATKALELSLREALQLGHNYIGPEHLLLGLLRQEESVAAKALASLDVTLVKARQAVITVLTDSSAAQTLRKKIADLQQQLDEIEGAS